jgi:ABC-2 type transport system permease protein
VTVTLRRVGALARRDLLLERSYQFQLLFRIGLIGSSVLTFFFLGRLVGTSDELAQYRGGYFEFALIGLLVVAFASVCLTAFARSIQQSQNDGTLEILLATSTPLPTLLAGTLVVPMLFAVVEGLVYLLVGAVVADLVLSPVRMLIAVLLLVLTLLTFAGFGVLGATVIVLTKRGDPVSVLILQATNLLGGAVFPVTVMPEGLQLLSRAVPAFYGLRGMREMLLTRGPLSAVLPDLLALVLFAVVLLPAALWALGRALRIARVTGTLGNR